MLTRRCFAIFCYLDARNGHLSLMRALRCSRVYLTATVVTCERLCASDNHGLLIYDMSAGNVDDGFRFYVIGFPVLFDIGCTLRLSARNSANVLLFIASGRQEIHSFIRFENIYSIHSRNLLGGAPSTSTPINISFEQLVE